MPGREGDREGKGYGLAGALAYRAVSLGLNLSRLPIVGRLFDRMAARMRLKVVTIPAGAAVKSNPAVLTSDIARQLVASASYIAAANVCLCRESHGCLDYPVGLGCLFLGPGARGISLRGRVRPITKDEALARLEQARSLGLITNVIWSTAEFHAIGADPAGTVELCSCCPCCCLAFKTRKASRAFIDGIAGFGVSRAVAPDECARCTNCEQACPFGAVRVDMHRGPVIDVERCKGCGRCETACRHGVLKIFPVEPAERATPLPGTMYLEEFLEMVK